MDLNYTPEQEAFRRRPALARGQRARRAARVPRHGEGFEQHREWERKLHAGRLGDGALAGGVRRPRRQPARVADLRGGVLPRRRARPRQPERHLPARPDHHGVRDAGAEGALPAEDGLQRGGLGPGLVGAQRRERHGGDPGHRRSRRRPLRAQRPEDLGLARCLRATGSSACSAPTRNRSVTGASPSSSLRSTQRA